MTQRVDIFSLLFLCISLLINSINTLKIPSFVSLNTFQAYSNQQLIKIVNEHGGNLPSTNLEPVGFKEYGSKRILMRYGPYKVPSSTEDNGMKEFNEIGAILPCKDCYITRMMAGLEYTNGSYANSNTGMWLHHVVLYDFDRRDLSCQSLPYRFFASGNERSPLDMTINGTRKVGLPLVSNTNMGITVEFMNEVPVARDVVLTLDIEYIPDLPEEFKPLDALWLDITGVCGESEAEVPEGKEVFEFHTPEVQVNSSGSIVAAGGHLHDGGKLNRVTLNGKILCDFPATYGSSAGFIDNIPITGSNNANSTASPPQTSGLKSTRFHISAMPLCYDAGKFKAGDRFGIIAYYNLIEHPPMLGSKGGLEPVMGISILYLENDQKHNPFLPGISITTAPYTGITITQAQTTMVNVTLSTNTTTSKPTTSPNVNITPGVTVSESTIIFGPSTRVTTLPIISAITISTLGFSSTLLLSTSLVITIVPSPPPTLPSLPTPTVSLPTISLPTISTPSISLPTISTPSISLPTISTPSISLPTISTPSISLPTISLPTISLPTMSTPSIPLPTISTPSISLPTMPTLTPPIPILPPPPMTLPPPPPPFSLPIPIPTGIPWTSLIPWWLTTRSKPGLVPTLTQSGRTSITSTAKITQPALLIPLPLIQPFGPTVYNPYWTLTIPIGLPYTTYVRQVETRTIINVIPQETNEVSRLDPQKNWKRNNEQVEGDQCPRGYPCGAILLRNYL